MFWITEDALRQWKERNKTGKRGKPKVFSDTAIEVALTLRAVFHLPLRQTEGFLVSVLERIGALVKAPDYSTLSIRSRSLSITIRVHPARKETLHLVVDSTGMKVYGEGEWKVRQHGWSKRRTWRKLHIGVDEKTGNIVLGEVTGNDTADCEMLEPLLAKLSEDTALKQVSADGALTNEPVMRRSLNNLFHASLFLHRKTRVSGRMATREPIHCQEMKTCAAYGRSEDRRGSGKAGITDGALLKQLCFA